MDEPWIPPLFSTLTEQAAAMCFRTGIYRDLALGADATHSAILSSMRDDGVDARAYLDERRAAFRDVVANEEEQKIAFLVLPGDSKSGKTMRSLSANGYFAKHPVSSAQQPIYTTLDYLFPLTSDKFNVSDNQYPRVSRQRGSMDISSNGGTATRYVLCFRL